MQNQLCTIHQKELQIICLIDFTKVCALCAVFGETHKDHKLKTVDEMTKMLSSTVDEFEQLKQKKKSIDSRIKNPEFKSQIVQKISTTKLQLSTRIKDHFTQIRQAVDQAQKNANDDLSKRFKQVHDKINKLAKQESEVEEMFGNWSRVIEQQMAEMVRVDLPYEQRVEIYCNKIMSSIKQGTMYLSQIEFYTEEKRKRMQSVPQMVTITLEGNLIKDIYNNVVIKFDDRGGLDKSDVMLMDMNRLDDEVLLRMEMEGRVNRSMTNQSVYHNEERRLGSPIKSKPISNPVILQPEMSDINHNYQRKPIKVEFSSSHNFLSPNKEKILSPQSGASPLRSYNKLIKSPSQKPRSLPKHQPPKLGSITNIHKKMLSPGKKDLLSSVSSFYSVSENRKIQTTIQGIVDSFLQDDKLDTLDLNSFEMLDNEIVATISVALSQKKIKCLKLSQNKLTNQGFGQILSLLRFTTNLNLSHNSLTEQVLSTLIKHRQKVPNLRILNLAYNKLNERKAKVYIQELKKQGIIVKL